MYVIFFHLSMAEKQENITRLYADTLPSSRSVRGLDRKRSNARQSYVRWSLWNINAHTVACVAREVLDCIRLSVTTEKKKKNNNTEHTVLFNTTADDRSESIIRCTLYRTITARFIFEPRPRCTRTSCRSQKIIIYANATRQGFRSHSFYGFRLCLKYVKGAIRFFNFLFNELKLESYYSSTNEVKKKKKKKTKRKK